MPGDFSRRVFDRRKHYANILMQQGRVQLDGDWNHQAAVRQHRDHTEARDVIGPCGAPKYGGGFEIGVTADGKDLTISAGTMYVDGLLCEMDPTAVPVTFGGPSDTVTVDSLLIDDRELQVGERVELLMNEPLAASPPIVSPVSSPPGASRKFRIAAIDTTQKTVKLDASAAEFQSAKSPLMRRVITYTMQPDYPSPEFTTPVSPPSSPPAPPLLQLSDGTYIAYIDAKQIEVNAGVDGRLREVALGGADTAVAVKNIAQVRLLRVTTSGTSTPSCDAVFTEWNDRIAPSTGRMNARTDVKQPAKDPCTLPPGFGYRSLENQLYRVQIHKGGSRTEATFKWSRENASIESNVKSVSGSVLKVSSLGRDNVLGFAGSQWIELVDDASELSGSPRPLAQTAPVNPDTREIPLTGVGTLQKTPRLRIRRWDQGVSAGDENGIAMTGNWQDLESGIQVLFGEGTYHSGDYWLVPARTATGEIEWPPFAIPNNAPIAQAPVGIAHHYCRLALIQAAPNNLTLLKDCRPKFPPLTHICAEDVCYDNRVCEMPGVKTVQDALDHLCQRHEEPAEAPAIHVVRVNLLSGTPLLNDISIPISMLARGIRVTCDREPFQNSVREKPVCFVTLELPFPFNATDRQLWGDAVVGFTPLILDASVNPDNEVIYWIPEAPNAAFLKALKTQMQELRRGTRVLARLTLKGNFIWDSVEPNRYLDGDAFGVARNGFTDIRYPSGDRRPGGDFEMWFWLTVAAGPLLKVRGVRILTVDPRRPDDPRAGRVLAELEDPGRPIAVRSEQNPNCIEVQFTGAKLDFDTVKIGSSMKVTERSGSSPPGERVFEMPDNTIRYVVTGFPDGQYSVELFGDPPSPIRSTDGDRLDGEPRRLPSGNDEPGGVFSFDFVTRFG